MQAQERANESFTKNIDLQSQALGEIAHRLEKLEIKTKGIHPSRFETGDKWTHEIMNRENKQ